MTAKPREKSPEFAISQTLATLSYPAARHMIELLLERPRTSEEFVEHLDVGKINAQRLAEILVTRGLATKTTGAIPGHDHRKPVVVYSVDRTRLVLLADKLAKWLT